MNFVRSPARESHRVSVVTSPRIIVSGATTAITRRTVLRKAFLAPWHPGVERTWLYALADAQRHTGVAVHLSVLNVSHHHTVVTPSQDNLPEFLRRFHRDLSCGLHTLLAAERYDAPRELFDDRPAHLLRLMDAPAQASRLAYDRLNPVAAGLVDRPEHMPQRALDFGLWKSGFVEVERPPLFFDTNRPERIRLELTPPPLLLEAFDGDLEKLIHHLDRITEHGRRALRAASQRPSLGAKAVRRLHPWSEPRTLRESGGQPVPTMRYGAAGMAATRQRIVGAVEVREFRRRHRDARREFVEGNREVRFPFGTYGARVRWGARTETDPPHDARVSRPGPLLHDVMREQSRRERESATGANTFDLLDGVRRAFDAEAGDIVDDATLDFATPAGARLDEKPNGGTAPRLDLVHERTDTTRLPEGRESAVVRHRFEPKREESASRVIVLRDRRRGRRRRSGGRGSSDPPR